MHCIEVVRMLSKKKIFFLGLIGIPLVVFATSQVMNGHDNVPYIDVFGTEYTSGETARVFLQLLNSDKTELDGGWCYMTMYNPDNTMFRNKVSMTPLGVDGIYYHDIQLPEKAGNYMVTAECNSEVSTIEYDDGTVYQADDDKPESLELMTYQIASNLYNISCPNGLGEVEVCYHGINEKNVGLGIYYDTVRIADIGTSSSLGWHCYKIPTSFVDGGVNEYHYYGIGSDDAFFISIDTIDEEVLKGQTPEERVSYTWQKEWLPYKNNFMIKVNASCISRITYNPDSTRIAGANEVHISEKIEIPEKSTMAVFGTEYIANDNGTTFLQLLDENGNAISDAYCEMTIFNTTKGKWFDSYPMTYLNGSNGMYYMDIYTQSTSGVYMLDAFCQYSDILYVYDLPSSLRYDGSITGGNSTNTVKDIDCLWLRTTGTYQEYVFNYSSIGNINMSEIAELSFIYVGMHKNDAYIEVYNYSSDTWTAISPLIDKTTINDECSRTTGYSYSLSNGELPDFVNQTEIRFRIRTVTSGDINTDEVNIIFHDTGTPINLLRGGGEIHVSDNRFLNLSTELFQDIILIDFMS